MAQLGYKLLDDEDDLKHVDSPLVHREELQLGRIGWS
jgi:hypothetical protein